MAAGCVRTQTPNRKMNLSAAVNESSKSMRSVVALKASSHPKKRTHACFSHIRKKWFR